MELSLQTTHQLEDVFEIEGKVEVDERRATGKYIGNSVELSVIAEEPEKDIRQLESLPPLTVGTPAMTPAKEESNSSNGYVDGHVRQKFVLGGLLEVVH